VDARKTPSHTRVKKTLLQVLKAGAGSMVFMTTVMSPTTTSASVPQATTPVLERAAAARTKLVAGMSQEGATRTPLELAWWRNWANGGWHPRWHNWPNWHNWHNWGNW
jgi:hypothetical protein